MVVNKLITSYDEANVLSENFYVKKKWSEINFLWFI